MTAETSPPCARCQGKSYVLLNENGRVQGALCDCFHCDRCGGEGRIFIEKDDGVSYLKDCAR